MDRDAASGQAHPLDDERLASGQVREFLPVHRSLCHISSCTLNFFSSQEVNLNFLKLVVGARLVAPAGVVGPQGQQPGSQWTWLRNGLPSAGSPWAGGQGGC